MRIGLSSAKNENGIQFDPRTKIMLLIAVTLIMISGKLTGVEFILRVICTLIPFLLLLNIRYIKTAIFYFVLFAFVEFGEGYLLVRLTGIPAMLLMMICGLISRLFAGYMMGWYLVKSTSVSEFITAMEKMHIPNIITIPLSVMFRYFPTLGEEYKSIHDAMKMREIGQSVKNPFIYMEYVLVPLMMSTVRIADELSAASLTKGLSTDGKRTHICEIKMRAFDWIAVISSFVMLVLFFVY